MLVGPNPYLINGKLLQYLFFEILHGKNSITFMNKSQNHMIFISYIGALPKDKYHSIKVNAIYIRYITYTNIYTDTLPTSVPFCMK